MAPLSVPFTFAAAGLNTPTTQLDADYAAIVSYINARNATIGPIGARPPAGNAGAWYVASDQNMVAYLDDGATWVQVTAGNVVPAFQVLDKKLTETTTVSTVAVDLVTLSPSTSIAATSFWGVAGLIRKTAGAAAAVSLGLKVNGVQIFANGVLSSAANQAEDGLFSIGNPIGAGARATNYLHGTGGQQAVTYVSATGVATGFYTPVNTFSAPLPTVPITSVTITGLTGSALVTLGITNLALVAVVP